MKKFIVNYLGGQEYMSDLLIEKKLAYFLKHRLVYMNEEKLLNFYQDKENYEAFLGMVSVLLSEDQLFLASFPLTTTHILEVINQKRFEYQTTGVTRLAENEIIVMLNELKGLNFYECRAEYHNLQSKVRMIDIKTDKELLRIVANDIYTIKALEDHHVSSIEKKDFLVSTAYLIEMFPELYIKNLQYVEETLNYIKDPKKDEDPLILKNTKAIQKRLKRCKKWKEKA